MKRTALATILAMALAPAWGQDNNGPNLNPPAPPDNANAGDAPDHGVARLSFLQGNVSMRHGDMGELSPTALNAPLVTTDRVITGDSGRAEIQFDFTNMIRLGPSTEVRLSELEFQRYQVQVAAGTTSFRVLQDNAGQVEISTPTISVHPVRAGTYRVSVRPDGITEITVRAGQAEIFGPQGSENLAPGQTMQARGTAADPEFQLVGAVPIDDFDRFNLDRDKVMQQTTSYRPGYVPPDVTGGEALDQNGQWRNDPSYGNVWIPNEPPGWAPYQDGRWIDESYYGWTWLGAEPWGWAPYHYGNWYLSSWGWAWWPGAFGPRHFWRPALVGFFGWGPGIGVGFGFGHVGWVPLAPFEAFHPWYGAGVGRFGISNVNAVAAYRNARVANAVGSMRAGDFGHTAVSSAGMIRPGTADLSRSGAIRGSLPVSATAASRRMSDAVVNQRGVPQTNANTRFFSRGATASVRPNTAPAAPAWRSLNGYNGSTGGPARGNTAGNTNGSPSGMTRGGATPQPGYGPSRGGSPTAGNNPSAVAPRAPAQQQPLRMNPPIVQPRSAPAQSAPARSTPAPSGGGGARSAPAPSRGGGGGGGGGHGGGGHR